MKKIFSSTFPGEGTRYNGITYGYNVKSYAPTVIWLDLDFKTNDKSNLGCLKYEYRKGDYNYEE